VQNLRASTPLWAMCVNALRFVCWWIAALLKGYFDAVTSCNTKKG
jgi:hypothetical protein